MNDQFELDVPECSGTPFNWGTSEPSEDVLRAEVARIRQVVADWNKAHPKNKISLTRGVRENYKVDDPTRMGRDDFQTPKWAIDLVIPYIPKRYVVWECCEGKGNIVNHLRDNGYQVVGTDIKTGTDFLTCPVPDGVDCIVTNFPFSIMDKMIERAINIGIPFAVLLPITAMAEKKRSDLWSQVREQVIIPNERICYETPTGGKSSPQLVTAWYTVGLNLPRDIVRVKRPPTESAQPKLFEED